MVSRVHLSLIAASLVAPLSAYAGEELPAAIIRIPESLTTLFIAETSTATFHRFDRSGDVLTAAGSYYMSIGKEGPGKERSGDKRTPFGAYIVTEQLDTSRLHDKYGVTAFPLDYPNAWDLRANRDGDGIWVHGVDPNDSDRPRRDTDGCIALPNEELSLLIPAFEENHTPVLITRKITWTDAANNESLRMELEERIAAWAQSKTEHDFHAYLSFYDNGFTRWGMSKSEWSAVHLKTDGLRDIASVAVANLLLLAYPEEDDVYFSRFEQTIVRDGRGTTSMARLYWRRDVNGVLKIIAQNAG